MTAFFCSGKNLGFDVSEQALPRQPAAAAPCYPAGVQLRSRNRIPEIFFAT
jgi:hypothetical protein